MYDEKRVFATRVAVVLAEMSEISQIVVKRKIRVRSPKIMIRFPKIATQSIIR